MFHSKRKEKTGEVILKKTLKMAEKMKPPRSAPARFLIVPLYICRHILGAE